MALRLIALDPGTDGDDCPAVFVDETSGDLVVQGPTVTEQAWLAEVNASSRIASDESVVRLPARMRQVVLKALMEVDGAGSGEDRV